MQPGTAVPSLHSHIVQSDDHDSNEIPKPFKSTRGKGGKKLGKSKQKSQLPPPLEKQEETFEEANNYYHNENYKGQNRGCRPYMGQFNKQYQYHQYYAHEDEYQVEQYGPPCALCSGYNHSPKHCFKGEHDINNLMEKMSLGSNNQNQGSLY